MRRLALPLAALLLAALSLPARAALNVFACEPEWGALATALGGADVSVFVATGPLQDPHQVQARPALISHLRFADVVICDGAELEIGWMPVLLRQGANAKVQPGTPGYFAAAEQVELLEKPTVLDRAQGDVHPGGNPHVQTDPRNVRIIAAAFAKRLAEIDPPHAAGYAGREKTLDDALAQGIQHWLEEAVPLKGKNFVSYHRTWIYLANFLGMKEVANIEPKPGVPPSSAYIADLLDQMPHLNVSMIVYSAYEDPKPSAFIADKTHLKAVMLPFTIGGTPAAKDFASFYEDTVKRLLAGLGAASGRS
jgi:zinc/manganese transport system substrate-binding protein